MFLAKFYLDLTLPEPTDTTPLVGLGIYAFIVIFGTVSLMAYLVTKLK